MQTRNYIKSPLLKEFMFKETFKICYWTKDRGKDRSDGKTRKKM